MSRKTEHENMGAGFSSLEIFQEPESPKDQLNLSEIWNAMKLFDGH